MKNKKDPKSFIKTLNPKAHGKTAFGGCDTCTLCCDGSTYTCANVLLDEMFDTAKLFPVVFSKTDQNLSLTLLYTLKRGIPCPYLEKETGHCEVYDSIRPRACKIYPFNIKEIPSGQVDNTAYAVVFDSRCPGIGEGDEDGTKLIGEDGKLSPKITRQFIGENMLRRYKTNLANTRKFLKLVKDLDLLVETEYDLGEPLSMVGYYGQNLSLKIWRISRKKLLELDADAVMEIHRHQFFDAVYTHLNSLRNLDKLVKVKKSHDQNRVDLLSFHF